MCLFQIRGWRIQKRRRDCREIYFKEREQLDRNSDVNGEVFKSLANTFEAVKEARKTFPALGTNCLTSAVLEISCAEADRHCAENKGHRVYRRQDKRKSSVLLDHPLPVILDMTARRCATCQKMNGNQPTYFVVTKEDVRRTLPHVHIFEGQKMGRLYVTEAFLQHVLMELYETFNIKEVRRRLYAFYTSNFLSLLLTDVRVKQLTPPPPPS